MVINTTEVLHGGAQYISTITPLFMGILYDQGTGPPLKEGLAWEWKFYGFTVENDDPTPETEYLSFKEAFVQATIGNKDFLAQVGWNPSQPKGKLPSGRSLLAGKLFYIVQSFLSSNLAKMLRIYPTVGTKFDQFHRGDGVLFLSDKSIHPEDIIPVVFDLSTRRKPQDRNRLIFYKDDFESKIYRFARTIANRCFHNMLTVKRQYR